MNRKDRIEDSQMGDFGRLESSSPRHSFDAAFGGEFSILFILFILSNNQTL